MLTGPLLAHCGCLDVIELDRDLAAHLQIRFALAPNLNIICADVLNAHFQDFRSGDERLRIVGNLPYNISTPLLFHLIEQDSCIQDMHFMLQKEVVDRICAEPGGKAFGRLSILLQYHCEAEKLFEVSPDSFRPSPKVKSAVVRLTPRPFPKYSVTDLDAFKALVARAFSRRRKTLSNALKGYLSADEIASADINPAARAETLDIAGYTRLTAIYAGKKLEPAG